MVFQQSNQTIYNFYKQQFTSKNLNYLLSQTVNIVCLFNKHIQKAIVDFLITAIGDIFIPKNARILQNIPRGVTAGKSQYLRHKATVALSRNYRVAAKTMYFSQFSANTSARYRWRWLSLGKDGEHDMHTFGFLLRLIFFYGSF